MPADLTNARDSILAVISKPSTSNEWSTAQKEGDDAISANYKGSPVSITVSAPVPQP